MSLQGLPPYHPSQIKRAAALGAHPKGPEQQAKPQQVPHEWQCPTRTRLMEGCAQRPIPRSALVPHSHTHAGCASVTHVYCFIANHAVTKQEEGPCM